MTKLHNQHQSNAMVLRQSSVKSLDFTTHFKSRN